VLLRLERYCYFAEVSQGQLVPQIIEAFLDEKASVGGVKLVETTDDAPEVTEPQETPPVAKEPAPPGLMVADDSPEPTKLPDQLPFIPVETSFMSQLDAEAARAQIAQPTTTKLGFVFNALDVDPGKLAG
jgi:hypothetical protein